MTAHHLTNTTPPASRARAGGRRLLTVATVLSVATAVIGAFGLAGRNAFADEAYFAVAQRLLGGEKVPALVLAIGLLGTVSAGIGRAYLGRGGRHLPGWLAPVGAVVALGSASVLGVEIISLAGYGVALAMPLAVAFVVVQLIRTGGTLRWFSIGAVAALLGGGVALGVLSLDSVGVFGLVLETFGSELLRRTIPATVMLAGLAWALIGLRTVSASGGLDRLAVWVLRHRTAITIVAASCPLPYALVRFTWLTPWKVFGGNLDAGGSTEQDQMILWGLMLSTGAWAGFVLTLGLIQRWGEIFPRWMPGVAGRPVPVWFAAVPGGLVATIMCAVAVPMLLMSVEEGGLMGVEGVVVFPFWLWGPSLALAVWGYVLHRRGVMVAARPSAAHDLGPQHIRDGASTAG